jgi:hypothetical protein
MTISKKDKHIASIPGNLRPNANKYTTETYPGNNFNARPIKHWRKQRTSINSTQTLTNSKDLLRFIDAPGSTIVNLEEDCNNECKNQYITNNLTKPKNNDVDGFSDKIIPCNFNLDNRATTNNEHIEQCISICNPQQKALNRVRYPSALNTNPIKPKYYPNSKYYLDSRCKKFTEKEIADTDNCNSQCCAPINKRSNPKFYNQGGVSSSSRIARLKVDTINKFANGFNNNDNFGSSVANAYAYSGKSETPFTVKNKTFNCRKGLFRKNGKKMYC